MTADKLSENYLEESSFCRFSELKGSEWQPEEMSAEDEMNSPEWTDSEEYFLNDRIPPESKAPKDFFKAQDMTNDDASYWEKELNELKESLKRFHINLAGNGNKVIEDMYKFRPSEEHEKGGDVKDPMAEIEKMDALLKMKTMEEKKAKLSRLQLEEESRTFLENLTKVPMTAGLKMNSEEFLRLLYDEDKADTGDAEEETEGEHQNNPDYVKEGKHIDDLTEKNFKPTVVQPKFIERNIQLARCGRGVLSLTDEEKLRIENLLVDAADPKVEDVKKPKMENPTKIDLYVLDDETKSVLSEIDQRLDAFSRERSAEASQTDLSLQENSKVDDDSVKKQTGQKKKKLPNRLSAINKLLSEMNSTTDKEISPLPPETISRLIEEAKESVKQVESPPSPEVIAELVSNAKVLMPKFKYRFEES